MKQLLDRQIFWRHLAILVLFAIVPLSFAGIIGNSALEHHRDLVYTRSIENLNYHTEEVLNFLDPVIYLEKRFKAFVDQAFTGEISPEKILSLHQESITEGITFVPYVFKNNQLITPKHLFNQYDIPMEKVWPLIHNYTHDDFNKVKNKVRAWFGSNISFLRLSHNQDRIMEISGKLGKGALYYHKVSNDTGALLIAWKLPETSAILKQLPDALKKDLKINLEKIEANKKRSSLQTRAGNWKENNTWLFTQKYYNNSNLVIGKEFPELNQNFLNSLFKICLLLFAIIIIVGFRHNSINNSISGFSIRIKLVCLVLYVVLLPLLGLSYFGWKLVTEKHELLRQEAFIACLDSINEIDTGFEREKEEIFGFYRSFKDLFKTTQTREEILGFMRETERHGLLNWIEIRDLQTEVVVTTQDDDTTSQLGVLGKTFARHGINNYLSHRIPLDKKLTPSASEVLIQEFLESPLGGWGRIFESPDELSQITFGGYDLLWYWDVFPDDTASAAIIVCDNHLHWAIKNYLSNVLVKRIAHRKAALRLIAWSYQNSMTIPGDEKLTGELANFLNQIKRNSQPQTATIEWNRKKWIVAGAPGKRLKDHVLICLYPTDEIEREISGFKNDLMWAMLFALFLAFLTGRLFSYTLIKPVSQLMLGVKAIRRRDTSSRLQIMQNDELGKLSQSFNKTIETLEDIIYAQSIQEQMIPTKAPEIDGFMADIAYIPTANLGGDYCDIQRISEKLWLFAIGDVTGHGVSSALVTAMAKSIITDYTMQLETDVGKILECMNEMLFKQFQRKKCMTFMLGILNAETGEFNCSNAGHPLPLHFSKGVKVPFPELFHPPLGFSVRNPEFPKGTVQMNHGDCLVFFTDIFIEARDKQGHSLGSAGLEAICRKYIDLNPDLIRQKLVEEIFAICGKELDDDLTLIVLKRNSPG